MKEHITPLLPSQLDQLGGGDSDSIPPQRRKLGTDAILSPKPHLAILSPKPHLQYYQSKATSEHGLWIHSRAGMGEQGTPYPQPNPTCPLGQQRPEEPAEKRWITELKTGLCVSREPTGTSAKLTG